MRAKLVGTAAGPIHGKEVVVGYRVVDIKQQQAADVIEVVEGTHIGGWQRAFGQRGVGGREKLELVIQTQVIELGHYVVGLIIAIADYEIVAVDGFELAVIADVGIPRIGGDRSVDNGGTAGVDGRLKAKGVGGFAGPDSGGQFDVAINLAIARHRERGAFDNRFVVARAHP